MLAMILHTFLLSFGVSNQNEHTVPHNFASPIAGTHNEAWPEEADKHAPDLDI